MSCESEALGEVGTNEETRNIFNVWLYQKKNHWRESYLGNAQDK